MSYPARKLSGKPAVISRSASVFAVIAVIAVIAAAAALAVAAPYPGTLSLSGIADLQVFQRSTRSGGVFAKGAGTMPATLSPSTPVAILELRIRNHATGATLVNWTTVGGPLAAQPQTLGLNIPAPASALWYRLDFRPDGDDSKIVSSPRCGMGEVTAAFGQSLCMDMFGTLANDGSIHPIVTIAQLGQAIAPCGSVFARYGRLPAPTESGPASWALPTSTRSSTAPYGYDSAFAARYLERMIAALDLPCALIGFGVGSTDIRAWLPASSANYSGNTAGISLYAEWSTVVTNAGGRFATLIWCQGHRSAELGQSQTQYVSYLTELMTQVTSAFPAVEFSRLISTIPAIKSTYTSQPAMNIIRKAGLVYVESDPKADLIDGLDVTMMSDLIHPSQAGNLRFADQFARAALCKLNVLTGGARGPRIIGAARDGANIAIQIQHHAAGTAMVGSGNLATQFAVYNSGTLTSGYSISAVNLVQPAVISITLQNPPAITQALDIWYRYPGDTSTTITPSIRDNSTDAVSNLGRQLALTNAAIAVPPVTAPATPGSPTVSEVTSSTQLTITWSDLSNNETSFKIQRSLTGTSAWTEIASLAANSTRHTDPNLSAATSYYYRLYAINAAGQSSFSPVITGSTWNLFQAWLASYALPVTPSSQSGDADADGDSNLAEYAFGSIPTDPNSRAPVGHSMVNGQLVITFTRTRAEVTCGVETSVNLIDWSELVYVPVPLGQTQHVTAPAPTGSGGRQFIRLHLSCN